MWGPNWIGLVSLKERKRHQHSLSFSAHTQTRGHVRTQQDGDYQQARRRDLTKHQPFGVWPTLLLALWPQNCEKKICCLSHPVCVIFLWQPEQRNTWYDSKYQLSEIGKTIEAIKRPVVARGSGKGREI